MLFRSGFVEYDLIQFLIFLFYFPVAQNLRIASEMIIPHEIGFTIAEHDPIAGFDDNQFTFPETPDNTADKPSSNINNIEASAEADFKELLEEAPALTLEPFAKEEVQPLETQTLAEKKPEAAVIDDPELTEEEKKMVMDFASQIDIENSQAVLQYGAGSQI